MANRQTWIVQHVTDDGAVYAREAASEHKRARTVMLAAEYVGEHAHLSYAATAYRVQGATVDDSYTVLTDAISAAGVYVGMTRGRQINRLHVVAEDMADARAQFIEAMERDRADRGLDHATAQAVEAVHGLTANGPVRLVTDELSRLDREAERAERAAERWEQIAAWLYAQRTTHRAEDAENMAALRRAEEAAEHVRAEVAQLLTVQAEHDGTAYLAAVEDEAAARARLATAGRFGRRKARAEHWAATGRTQTRRAQLRDAWGGEPPRTSEALPDWAEQQAAKRAEADPRVLDATRAAEAAQAEREVVRQRHKQEHTALLVSEYGADRARRDHLGMRVPDPRRSAHDARARAAATRAEAELRSLPVNEAARRIEAKQIEQENSGSGQQNGRGSLTSRSSTTPTAATRAATGRDWAGESTGQRLLSACLREWLVKVRRRGHGAPRRRAAGRRAAGCPARATPETPSNTSVGVRHTAAQNAAACRTMLAAAVFTDEPSRTGPVEVDAAFAALAEHLAQRDGWPTPAWVFDPSRRTTAWYPGVPAIFHADTDQESPEAFRRRGILITSRSLARA